MRIDFLILWSLLCVDDSFVLESNSVLLVLLVLRCCFHCTSILNSPIAFFRLFSSFSLFLFLCLFLSFSLWNSNKAESLEFYLCILYFNRAWYVSYAHQYRHTLYIHVKRHMRKWYKWELHGHRVLGAFFVVTTVVVYTVYTLRSYGLVT